MSTEVNAIEAHDLTLTLGGHEILSDVTFAIPKGTYAGLVGPNGGGKTTLIKIILGLLQPTSGTIRIFGTHPTAARKRARIGYVPQRIAQHDIAFPVSVEEMVWSGRTPITGIRQRTVADKNAVDEALQRTGTSDLKYRLVGGLSGGQRQRVFIARALASKPDLLILDEPTTGVDIAAKQTFYALLKELNTSLGLTILFVSHDIEVMTREVSLVLALNQTLLCNCTSGEFSSGEILKSLYGKDVHEPHYHHH